MSGAVPLFPPYALKSDRENLTFTFLPLLVTALKDNKSIKHPCEKRVANEALVSIQTCVFEGEISSVEM
jgi:hypothetical protein